MERIPIVIDTDIGFDMDDTWALAYALACGRFDVKLISLSEGDLDYKLRLTCRLLTAWGREDVPVAVGKPNGSKQYPRPITVPALT